MGGGGPGFLILSALLGGWVCFLEPRPRPGDGEACFFRLARALALGEAGTFFFAFGGVEAIGDFFGLAASSSLSSSSSSSSLSSSSLSFSAVLKVKRVGVGEGGDKNKTE